MRLFNADEFFKNYPELAIEPYINAPIVKTSKIEYKAYNEGFKDGVDQGIKLSERPQGEWISVDERLPEKDGVYLVTLEYVEERAIVYEIDMAKFVYSEKDDCNNGFHKAYTVIAWQPLPEPYQRGGAE